MNENKITCGVCRDLMPLVKDGVASADSETAVRQHIHKCGDCAMLFDGKYVPAVEPSESPKAILRIKRWLSGVYAALMLLGIYFGLSLTAGVDMFCNCLIMPFVGAFGYLVFRCKSLFAVPIILVIIQVIVNAFGLFGTESIDFLMLIFYILFALAGVVISMLLHFAFGKREKEGSGENER